MTVYFDGADIVDLLTLLRATGLSASTESAKVETPGVWVRIDTVHPIPTYAGGSSVPMTLHVVVQGQSLDDAWTALTPHVNAVLDVLYEIGGPSGPVVPTALQLQPSGTGLPCLAIPYEMHTIPTIEETP